MKKLLANKFAKAIAIIFFLILSSIAITGLAGIVFAENEGYYNASEVSFFDSTSCFNLTNEYANEVLDNYYSLTSDTDYNEGLAEFNEFYEGYEGNLSFEIFEEGELMNILIYSNKNENVDHGLELSFSGYGQEKVVCYVQNPLYFDDEFFSIYSFYKFLYPLRYWLITITLLSGILSTMLLVFILFTIQGEKEGKEKNFNIIDKIPFDFYTIVVLLSTVAFLGVSFSVGYPFTQFSRAILLVIAILAVVIMGLSWFMTLVKRIKNRMLFKKTLVYRSLEFIKKHSSWTKDFSELVNKTPLIMKTVLIFIIFEIFNYLLAFGLYGYYYNSYEIFFWSVLQIIVLIVLLYYVLELRTLKKGVQKISDGDLEYKINTKGMIGSLKKHGENLNNIGEGMQKAVDERIKSERFKAELITNVSHDIKTPLTSIINYVDLLKKVEIKDENAIEYIGVLERQSARLKKLTEDLVEASKASTGNIPVNAEITDFLELVNQSIAEYQDKFIENNLETVISKPKEKVLVMADGRLMWRVFDNVLNNIVKYSQSGTRVYFDVIRSENEVIAIFKNISQNVLNVSPDELMERFVRGDSSRNTQGSGLGLSIAKSLTELQNGKFAIYIDGDLFKVIIRFDLLNE